MLDPIGDRMKQYEAVETTRRLDPSLPIMARIDGRSFSKFTRNAIRPFDTSISNAMVATASELVRQTGALISYVQSDEITLVWETSRAESSMFFDAKVMKITSVISGIATAAFIRTLIGDQDWNDRNPDWLDRLPHFDARVFQLPSRTEAANAVLWREMDARKNAITMVASTVFSHRELQGQSGRDKLAMLERAWEGTGKRYDDYPVALRRGTFIKRVVRELPIDEMTRCSIPEHRRPEPNALVKRSFIEPFEMPQFNLVDNRVGVIFENELPVVRDSSSS